MMFRVKNKFGINIDNVMLTPNGELFKYFKSNIIKVNSDEYIIEKFSGLRDMHNVPIYEGDILGIKNSDKKDIVVVFDDGSFSGKFIDDDSMILLNQFIVSELEILN